MRINVNFTVEVPSEDLPTLKELAQTDNATGAADFIRGEASEHITSYLTDNGIRVELTRGVL